MFYFNCLVFNFTYTYKLQEKSPYHLYMSIYRLDISKFVSKFHIMSNTYYFLKKQFSHITVMEGLPYYFREVKKKLKKIFSLS